ncbi:hypothetical protein DFH09DRAFT_1083589 [Mycena vulgaris]|nr:hypothetical protein DFH09DRAFT_1083589 [Mycena vulgaris]
MADARGPSTRITEYHRAFMLRAAVQSTTGECVEEEMITRDQISSAEVNLLFGYINKGDPSLDIYLFPPQWLLEEECPGHFHGVMGPAAQELFDYMITKIASPAIGGCWRTIGKWRSFLRTSDKRKYAPKDWPKDDDFKRGSELLKGAFEGTWNLKALRDITLPEPFLEDVPGESPYDLEF